VKIFSTNLAQQSVVNPSGETDLKILKPQRL
jgi:hypothetical protein